jgi:hypothetical protein
MTDWITVISFSVASQAYLAKARLESEGIEVFLKDELTMQVYALGVIGGVKLQVREVHLDAACQILIEMGYLEPPKEQYVHVIQFLDRITSSFPFIGNTILEIRLVAIVALLLMLIVIALLLYHSPSTFEHLTSLQRYFPKGEIL